MKIYIYMYYYNLFLEISKNTFINHVERINIRNKMQLNEFEMDKYFSQKHKKREELFVLCLIKFPILHNNYFFK